MVKIVVIPGHCQGCRSARAAAHCGPTIWIFGEFDVILLFDEGEDLGFDELDVAAGHGVVFEAALAALGVAAAVADGDGDHDGNAVLSDEVI